MATGIDVFEQGMEASVDLKPRDSNPYVANTAAHDEWALGWDEAEEDWEKVCKAEAAAGRP